MSLRLATPGDAESLRAIFAPYVLETAISFAVAPPSTEMLAKRVTDTLADFPFLVLEEEGAVAGFAYAALYRTLAAYRWTCETTIYLDRDRKRRGGGRRLYGALLSLLRAQGLQQAYAAITLPNDASVGLHEALGFRAFARFDAVGFKQGAWRDVGWWGLRLQPSLPANPPEPVSFAALRENESSLVSRILAESREKDPG